MDEFFFFLEKNKLFEENKGKTFSSSISFILLLPYRPPFASATRASTCFASTIRGLTHFASVASSTCSTRMALSLLGLAANLEELHLRFLI